MGCMCNFTATVTKYILFFTNVIFVLCGLTLIVGSALIDAYLIDTHEIWEGELRWLTIAAIIIGSMTFLVAFSGCCGAITKNPCLLNTYGVLLLCLLFAQFAVCVAAIIRAHFYNHPFSIEDNIYSFFVREYQDGESRKFDAIQQDLRCCGVYGAEDYISIFQNGSLPTSCCNYGIVEKCLPILAYKNGCLNPFMDNVDIYAIISASVFLGTGFIELVAAIAAFCLAGHFVNKESKKQCDKCDRKQVVTSMENGSVDNRNINLTIQVQNGPEKTQQIPTIFSTEATSQTSTPEMNEEEITEAEGTSTTKEKSSKVPLWWKKRADALLKRLDALSKPPKEETPEEDNSDDAPAWWKKWSEDLVKSLTKNTDGTSGTEEKEDDRKQSEENTASLHE